jgi:hypothetical protein
MCQIDVQVNLLEINLQGLLASLMFTGITSRHCISFITPLHLFLRFGPLPDVLPVFGRQLGAMVAPNSKDEVLKSENAFSFLSSKRFDKNRGLQDVHIPCLGADT